MALFIIAVVGIPAFFIGNAILFKLGSQPFDMTDEKVWSYVAANYGPFELYHLPNVVSLAKVWGGVPRHEAIMPYGFGLAYYFTLIGWVYRLLFSGPGPLLMDTFQLEFVIKAFNNLFALADALLIYLILRHLRVSHRSSLLGTALFLFNPAVWFVTSVWGQTYVVSLFFLLASIWLAEKGHPFWAWLALAAGSFCRPQMLVPAFLLGLVFLRKYSLRQNLHAISWTVIVAFLFLGPFALALSPSLPVDVMANLLLVQPNSNEALWNAVSLDAYSIWPLVTHFSEGASGLARIFYPGTSPLIGQFSYQRVSQLLVSGLMLIVAGLLLFRRRLPAEPGDYIPLLALGNIGMLLLMMPVAAIHFSLGLPLLILCRKSFANLSYYSFIAIWTVTTVVPMYGGFGFGISNVGYLAPALHHSNNALTRFFMDLYSADWFITLGTYANIVVLVWLGVEALRPLWPRWRRRGLPAEAASTGAFEDAPRDGD